MPRLVTLDFSDAPPAQGGGGSDHIPAGLYAWRIRGVEFGNSRAGRPMFTVRLEVAAGPKQGSRNIDYFVVSGTDSNFGKARFHAFLLALGAKVPPSGAFPLDLDLLNDRMVAAQVRDEVQAATDQYPERLTSRVDAYYSIAEMQQRQQPPTVAQGTGAAPAAAAQVITPVPVLAQMFADTPAAPVAVATNGALTDAEPITAVAQEVGDLFS